MAVARRRRCTDPAFRQRRRLRRAGSGRRGHPRCPDPRRAALFRLVTSNGLVGPSRIPFETRGDGDIPGLPARRGLRRPAQSLGDASRARAVAGLARTGDPADRRSPGHDGRHVQSREQPVEGTARGAPRVPAHGDSEWALRYAPGLARAGRIAAVRGRGARPWPAVRKRMPRGGHCVARSSPRRGRCRRPSRMGRRRRGALQRLAAAPAQLPRVSQKTPSLERVGCYFRMA